MRRHAKAATAGSTKRLGRSKPALLACVLAAAVAALALVVGSASGATTRFLVETFGSSAQPTFPADRGMAYDQGADQLYVIDSTNDTISRFNANGTAANFGALGSNVIDGEGSGDETPLGHLAFESNRQREQIAIDESGGATDGNIYATRSASDVVDVFASDGEYKGTLSESTATGAFGEPCGVAVDSAGTVYVGDRGDDRIHVYVPAGAVPVNADNTASFATVTDPCTLAAGAGATAGFLFVNASTGAQLRKVDAATGEVKYQLATGASTVSVDPATGHVFVARNTFGSSSVDEYDASGAASATLVSSFKPGSTVEGIALNSGAEGVYVARSGTEDVEVFGPAVVAPDVTTEPVASNTGTRATLAGTVNPDGVQLDECFFEWTQSNSTSTPSEYENTVPCAETPAEIGAGTSPVAVSAEIGGLKPQGTKYHYRLVAVNPNATVNGSNQSFATPDTVIAQAASGIAPTEATLNGTVNPDTATISECLFEYGPPKEAEELLQKYPESAPCVPGPGGIGSGTSPVAVKADLSGLQVGSAYRYRLKATYPTGPVISDPPLTFQTAGPRIAAWSEDVFQTEARLRARIDPEGSATTYRFEYGPSAAYGSATPEIAVGSDSSVHEVGRFLEGLTPGTTYHYRLVATSGVAENTGPDQTFTTFEPFVADTECPNQGFRTGASAKLPDCRAYELVSPLDKNGGDIVSSGGLELNIEEAYRQASPDGERITYSSTSVFGDAASANKANQYISTRGAGGWSTHGVNPPFGTTLFDPNGYGFSLFYNAFEAFSEDLCSALLRDENLVPLSADALVGHMNVYLRDNCGPGADGYTALTTELAFPRGVGDQRVIQYGNFSADGSHAVFGSQDPLTPDSLDNDEWKIYDFSGGELELVSVLPGGEANPDVSVVGNDEFSSRFGSRDQAVSDDGSRIFWTSGGTAFTAGELHVRIDGEETVQISAAGDFWTATPDGAKALFSQGTLNGATGDNLFEFDVDAETTTPIAGRIGGVVGASDDLSRIYLTSKEDLAPGAVEGEWNLYLREGGAFEHIAIVSAKDRGDTPAPTIDHLAPVQRASRVTPDGRGLVFMSTRPLTGYDNRDAQTGEPASEVFHYDADTDTLTCASCRPSGARPMGREIERLYGRAGTPPDLHTAAWLPTWEYSNHAKRSLSDDGNRVFFNAYDPILPQDTNGAQDVYQWEAQGTGSCERPGGCLSLISSGQDPEGSELVEASADGNDVFIETSAGLDPRDVGGIDYYDARAGGGFQPPPPPPPPCVGDACQSIPPAPDDPTPASAGFRGAGSPPAARNCGARAKRAAKLSRRAKRARRAAKRSGSQRRSKRLRRSSTRMARKAKRLSRGAKRCRRANRRANR